METPPSARLEGLDLLAQTSDFPRELSLFPIADGGLPAAAGQPDWRTVSDP
jgi:sulfur relay (sulfurtransferase) DsrF/TusC family protein